MRLRHTPASSADDAIPRWTSWPQRGKPQWVEIDLGRAQEIVRVGVYWYDDGGGVQLPGQWHLEIPEADGWERVEIYNTDRYSTLPDVFNTVQPARPLKAAVVRIVMQPRHDRTCVGILAVEVETRDGT